MRLTIKNRKITGGKTIGDYFLETRQETKRSTARIYAWHVKWFLDWLRDNDLRLEGIENPERVVTNYLKDLFQGNFDRERKKGKRTDSYTKKTTNVTLYALKRLFFKFLGMDFDTKKVTLWGRESDFKPIILDREKEMRILNRAESFDYPTLLRTGWHCALRSSEIIKISGDSLLDENIVRCPISKSRKERYKKIKVPEELYDRLKKVNKIKQTPGIWSYLFKEYLDNLDMNKEVRWHDFARHTRLTHFAEDTKNFMAVLHLSGHQNPAVAKRYFERAEIKVPELEKLPEPWYDFSR